jgi:membrane protein
MIILGEKLIYWIAEYHNFERLNSGGVFLLRWTAIIGLIYFSIGVLYRYGASLRRKISIFSPGTSLATLLSVVASLGFSYYVNAYGKYDQLYGSIGAVMVLMLWIQLNALALLIGYELNASIALNRDLKKKLPDEENLEDEEEEATFEPEKENDEKDI